MSINLIPEPFRCMHDALCVNSLSGPSETSIILILRRLMVLAIRRRSLLSHNAAMCSLAVAVAGLPCDDRWLTAHSQCLSQDLETGCPKLASVRFLGSYFSRETTIYLDNNHKHVFTHGNKAKCPYAIAREVY